MCIHSNDSTISIIYQCTYNTTEKLKFSTSYTTKSDDFALHDKLVFQTMSCDPFLVVAIDFGTTYSGFAFQWRHEYSAKDPTVITAPQSWSDGTKQVLSLKTPTALLLNGDLEIDSFGYEAERKYSNLCEENKHADWYFYRRFKMKLQNRGV